MSRSPFDRVAGVGLAALVLLFFWKAVFVGQVLYFRDIHLFTYPQMEVFARSVAAGSWPVWDPWSGFGQPLLADASAQLAYPFTWINLVVQPWTFFTLLATSHLLLSGVGLYALARRLDVSPHGSFAAGALWIASGPMLSLVNLRHHFTGAAWIPWVVWAADRALASPRWRDSVVWGAILAAQVLAGSADMCAMTLCLVALVVGRRLWREPRERRRAVAWCALAGGFALSLSAAQWLPTLEVARHSARFGLAEEVRTYWSVHPVQMLQVAAPVFVDQLPLRPALRGLLFESREPFVQSLYLGLPAFALVLAAFAGPRRPLRGALGLVALLGGAVALGKHAPVYGLLTALVPPLKILRYPSKAMILVAFAFALLGGMGFDAWGSALTTSRRRWGWRVVAPTLVLVAAAAAAVGTTLVHPDAWATFLDRGPLTASWSEILAPAVRKLGVAVALGAAAVALGVARLRGVPGSRLAAALAVLAVADLWLAERHLNPTGPRELFTYRPPTLAAVGQDDRSRLYVYDYFGVRGRAEKYLKPPSPEELSRLKKEWPYPFAEVIALRTYLFPPVAETWGVFGSFELDARGLYPNSLAQLTLLLRAAEGRPAHLRLLRLGAVSRVFALHEEGLGDLTPVGTFDTLLPEPIRVFAVPAPLPRAYAVDGVRTAEGKGALAILAGDDFDPTREVVLEVGAPRAPSADFSGRVRIARLDPDRVVLEADLSGPGYVVLVDAADPGWRCRVDGHDAPIATANMAFRAVAVPAGRHTVEQVYRPPGVIAGLALSAAGLVAAAVASSGASRGTAG